MYKITVNKSEAFDFEMNKEAILINGEKFNSDLTSLDTKLYHIIYRHKSYTAEVVKADWETKKITLKINGKIFETEAKDNLDLLLEKMGLSAANTAKVDQIKAPMPGLIVDIKVKEGDEVKKGDPIMILEAMKMENVLKSPGEGIIKAIKVQKGDKVEKNQVMILF
jgi:biotin carboxyl carrier protein